MEDNWNDGYWVEGLDRTNNIREDIERLLIDHPAIVKAGVQSMVENASKILGEAYQMIGAATVSANRR